MKKILPILIVASLAVNAALAFYVFRGDSGAATTAPARPGPQVTAAPKSDTPAPMADMLPSVASNELPTIIAELRAKGFPPEMVRAIATALLNEQFSARQKALDPDADKRPFWKDPYTDPKYQRMLSMLWLEQRKALRDLLGPEADAADPYTQARQRQQFGNLSPEKLSQVMDIARSIEDKKQEVYSSGVYTKEERDKVTALDKQARAAVAQILTPAELEEYDLRNSNTGRSMRTELSAFNPTEEEFRAIFKLRQPYDEQWNQTYDAGLPSQAEMDRRNAASKQMMDQIKAALGPERGQDYEIASDYNYRRVSQVVARLELPPETTRQLWDTQKSFQQRITDIRRATSDPTERIAQLTALQQEATTKINTMLGGSRGLEAYKQYGGSWLNNIVPRAQPAKKN